jgi:hypothetical protein
MAGFSQVLMASEKLRPLEGGVPAREAIGRARRFLHVHGSGGKRDGDQPRDSWPTGRRVQGLQHAGASGVDLSISVALRAAWSSRHLQVFPKNR